MARDIFSMRYSCGHEVCVNRAEARYTAYGEEAMIARFRATAATIPCPPCVLDGEGEDPARS